MLSGQRLRYPVPIQSLQADHHDATVPRPGAPWLVEPRIDPLAHALHQQAHGLSFDCGKALHAKNIEMRRGEFGPLHENRRAGETRKIDDETFEIVVIVLFLIVVMGRPRREIVFGGGIQAEKNLRGDRAMLSVNDFYRAGQNAQDLLFHASDPLRIQQIGLVQNDEIGRQKLILEHLFQRIFMVERLSLIHI